MPRQKSTHVDDPKAVGERLRTAREAAGLSQRQLAFTGCSPAYISRIEGGDRIPSLQLLRELGRRLGVAPSAIGRWERGDVAPSIETLRGLVRGTGHELTLGIAPGDEHDLALIRRSLSREPAERLSQLGSTVRELRRMAAAGG